MSADMAAGTMIKVPIFSKEKSYDVWQVEIKAWQKVTTVEENKQALAIALALPEGSEVRTRVFEETGPIDELNSADGVKKLLERLDKWYKKDNLSAAYEAWTGFDMYKRSKDITIDSYISEFMRKNNELQKYVKVPKSIVAFKMLDNAGLNFADKQIALTAVSFEEEEKLVDLMMQSLRKFFGSQEVFVSNQKFYHENVNNAPSITIKNEPVFNTEEVQVVQRGRNNFRGKISTPSAVAHMIEVGGTSEIIKIMVEEVIESQRVKTAMEKNVIHVDQSGIYHLIVQKTYILMKKKNSMKNHQVTQ